MTPVFQTTKENCLSAAVATVLDIPLCEVPVWWNLTGDEWIHAISEWAKELHLGMCYFNLRDRKEWPLLMGHYVIVAGSTARSKEYLHAVVAMAEWTGEETRLHWVHDPCEGGGFITDPDHCLFFVPQQGRTVNA